MLWNILRRMNDGCLGLLKSPKVNDTVLVFFAGESPPLDNAATGQAGCGSTFRTERITIYDPGLLPPPTPPWYGPPPPPCVLWPVAPMLCAFFPPTPVVLVVLSMWFWWYIKSVWVFVDDPATYPI